MRHRSVNPTAELTAPSQVFDDFCLYADAGLQLWTQQTYYTQNYYCKSGSEVCIHLQVQYLGHNADGSGNAANMDYNGCMVCGSPISRSIRDTQ